MVIVAGGGLSGLSTAYFLQKMGIESLVIEAGLEAGGCIRSDVYKNCLLEAGPNSLLYSAYIEDLIVELQLENEVLEPTELSKDRFIYKKGKYRKLPSGPLSLMKSNFFSMQTKLKIFKELFRKPGLSGNIFLKDFFIEHFGKEVADYALTPFVSGIYAGDPEKLLVEETFPSLYKFEKENGSIIKGMIKNAGIRKKLISFKNGMQTLPKKIAEKINIQYNSKLVAIEKINSTITRLVINKDGKEEVKHVSYLVLALPAFEMQKVLDKQFSDISLELSKVRYVPMTVVYSLYNKADVSHNLNGFGGLNPKVENRFSAGSIWTSSIFPSRCGENFVLFTTFVGGALYEQFANADDNYIQKYVNYELQSSFAINSKPVFQKCTRWENALPQYEESILKAKKSSLLLEKENIFVCSNIFGGVSIEDCIKKGEATANKIKDIKLRYC